MSELPPREEHLRLPQETVIQAAHAAARAVVEYAARTPLPDMTDKPTVTVFKDGADEMAVEGIRGVLSQSGDTYRIVSCEGKNTDSPAFDDGEIIGSGGKRYDVVIDPLDGTSSVARGDGGATVLIRVGEPDSIYQPTTFGMEGIVGKGLEGLENPLDMPVEDLIRIIAERQQKDPSEVVLALLKRPFLQDLVARIKAVGAQALEIPDGAETVGGVSACLRDVAPANYMRTPQDIDFNPPYVDAVIGKLGAPETVVLAGVAKATNTAFYARELDDATREPKGKTLTIDDMVKGPTGVVIAGIQDSQLLRGAYMGPDDELVIPTLYFQSR